MAVYTQTPTWPPVTLTDTEQIIDFIRQQAKREIEEEQQKAVEDEGVKGVRWKLANAIEDAERLDDFPIGVLCLLRTTYDLLWEQMRQ